MTNSSPQLDFFSRPQTQAALAGIIHERQIIRAFQKFRENKIEPILIKGWSIARFYPKNKKRKIGDIDLCFAPEVYEKAQRIEAELEFPAFTLDLHKGLRHLDKLPFEDLFQNSQLVELHGEQIRVLCPEDNLRVTCVHWLNDGGADKEKLWDIYYLIENRPPDFDWDRFLNATGKKRRQWLVCTIAAAHRWLNLNVDDTPIAVEVKNPKTLPGWFVSALEREWNDTVKIGRLDKFIHKRNWKSLAEQLRRRFPPNPIMSSVLTEAPFDNKPRFPYQIANIFQRFFGSLNRNVPSLLRLFKILPDKNRELPF